MNKRDFKFIFAPIGVAFGIFLFISVCIFITNKFGVSDLYHILRFIPKRLIFSIGIITVLTFLPIFVIGIFYLNRRGAVGQSDSLVTNGIYKYVRNPMYSGISFTIFGIGFLLNKTGVVLAGILWLLMTFIQCKREEKELNGRFGEEYMNYKNSSHMFIPNFKKLMTDIIQNFKGGK
ncbi:MAG: isoprenylcysteine carboxylmethyltransferase family protein [Candidatus Firestonebacteria bacterium]